MPFQIEKSVAIDELKCQLTLYQHETGARVVHIANDDPENLFCLAFRTLPESSNGVAHILEHTVLCGSEKYPVKDPFFCMIRRSLNTFMNAMTGDDMTFYPAASQVKQDFYNLLSVYCDAVFHPKLDELSFMQEGHRLELENDELIYKGIVFNEMKGAMATPDARAWAKISEMLFPDTPYRFNSGGDPAVIPELTYEGLLDFHRTHYHPSRCIFYFYGNLPIEGHLDFLEHNVLSDSMEPLGPIPHQPRFKEPKRVTATYPDETTDGKTMTLFGWLTCEATDQLEILSLTVLDEILMGTDASPLKAALLKSGLCKEAYSGLDTDTADVPYLFFLKGTEDPDAIETLLFETLKNLQISPAIIEGAIHQLEIDRFEITGDAQPFGLTLFRRTVPLLMFGGNPEDGLTIHTLFQELRRRFADPNYLTQLIDRYLLNNAHFVRIVMEADPKQAERELQAEKGQLAQITPDREKLTAQAQALKALQDEEPDVNVLPKVTLDDVPKDVVDFPLTQIDRIYAHPCFTNGLVYASLVFDLPHIADEDLPYARLLISLLPEVGCGGRSYKENLDYIQAHTGGVDTSLSLHPQATDFTQFRPALSVSGKALVRKQDKLLPLLQEMVLSADLTDRSRLQELLMQHHSSLENSLTHNALKYAVNLAGAGRFPSAYVANKWYGLDYLYAIRKIVNEGKDLVDRLQSLQKQLLCAGEPHLILASEQIDLSPPPFPSHPFTPWKTIGTLPFIESQGRVIASPVAFTCKMVRGVPYAHPDAPALSIASRLFNHQTLHREIREKGGAYGAGAVNHLSGGGFYFYCYRDPNLTSSLSAIDLAIDRVANARIAERELEEAKLTIVQKLDSPISPGSRAEVSYARWREDKPVERRQAFRDRFLSLTIPEIAEAVQKHLTMEEATTVCFAGRDLLEREKHLPIFNV